RYEVAVLVLDHEEVQVRGGGLVPAQVEIVCQSGGADSQEQCLLERPAAGAYWAIVQNFQASAAGVDDAALGLAQIGAGAAAGSVTVAGPSSVGRYTPFDVTVGYDLPALAEGLTHLALLDVGTSGAAPGDIGTAVLVITPGDDDGDLGLIFADGFESGDLGAWSATVD
ncbi:MAG: hypothetical protein AAFX50_14725, partial [Acidobacteriota bacterium]